MRFVDLARETGRLAVVISSMDSEKEPPSIGMGGSSCGALLLPPDPEGPSSSSSECRSTERPSSVESDMRGIGSPSLNCVGNGGGGGESERVAEPCVLTLNLEFKPEFKPPPTFDAVLCRRLLYTVL